MSDYTGADVDNQASNPGAVTSYGDFSITAQPPEAAVAGGNFSSEVAGAIMSLFGIPQALAATNHVSVLMDSSGQAVGFIYFSGNLVPLPGINLAALLLGIRGSITRGGTILGPNIIAGQINGFSSMPNAALGISVYVDEVTAVNLDNPSIGMTVDGVAGAPLRLGFYPGHVWGQCHGVTGPTGVLPVTDALYRTWNSTGINTSKGIPIINYNNVVAMFKGQQSLLLPDFIGGRDGIYSLRTGKRLVPDASHGPAPLGFDIGQYADFRQTDLELIWDSNFYVLALGLYDDIETLSPKTGQLIVPTWSTTIKVFNGSQQANIIGAPPSYGWNYAGPNPTAASPGWGSSLAGVLAISSSITNNAIWTPQQLETYYQGGGTEGPGEGEDR